MTTLGQYSTDLVTKYLHIYRENRPSGAPATDYYSKILRRTASLSREYGIPAETPHYTYRNLLPLYDEIYVLLSHMGSLYRSRGIAADRLEASRKKYVNWFMGYKRQFNRCRSQRYLPMEELIRGKCHDGTLEGVLGNHKLAAFVTQVVLERRVFDYVRLDFVD